jgi:hypothetical protein
MVQYCVVQLVAEMVASLGVIKWVFHPLYSLSPNNIHLYSKDLYTLLCSSLLTQISDKEAPICIQAIKALWLRGGRWGADHYRGTHRSVSWGPKRVSSTFVHFY